MKDNLHIMQKVYDYSDDYSNRNGLEFNWNVKPYEEELIIIIIFFTILWKRINWQLEKSVIVAASCDIKNWHYDGLI